MFTYVSYWDKYWSDSMHVTKRNEGTLRLRKNLAWSSWNRQVQRAWTHLLDRRSYSALRRDDRSAQPVLPKLFNHLGEKTSKLGGEASVRFRAQRAGNCMIKKYPAKILWHRRLENLDLLFRYGENFDDFLTCFCFFRRRRSLPELESGWQSLKMREG